MIFDRELCSKVLKEALLQLFLFFLASNHEKICAYGNKNLQWNEKCSNRGKVLPFMAHFGIELLCVALYGLMWPCKALCGRMALIIFKAMAMCGLIRLNVACFGLVWSCMALQTYGNRNLVSLPPFFSRLSPLRNHSQKHSKSDVILRQQHKRERGEREDGNPNDIVIYSLMALYSILWYFMAVLSRGHRSKFIWSCYKKI